MFEPGFEQNFMAMFGIPLVVWITALGTGLAIERLLRTELPNALLLPLGLAGEIVLVYPLYALGLSDVPAVALLMVVTGSGLIWARGGVRSRLNPGLPGVAGLAVYLLLMLPVLVDGHWLWLGYEFNDDTAVQFLLTAALKSHGTHLLTMLTSDGRTADAYFTSGYPLGAHALLATLSGTLHSDPAVLYQGFLGCLGALIATTVAAASTRAVGRYPAVLLGLAAASANLFVQYVYQGTIKEIATTATIIAAFAIGSEAIRARQPYRGVAVTSIPLAATLCTYGVAGGPYVLGMIGAVALYLVVVERRVPRPAWFGPSLVGGALVVALAIPAVVEFSTLFNIAQAVVGSANPTGNALGTLARPLPISQISGVWLDGDFRLPVVAEPAGDLTVIASVAILVLAIPGVLTSIRRRDPAPLLATVTTGLVLLIVVPRVTPYAVGKVYAMASPIVVWTAGIGLSAFAWRRLAPLAVAIGVALTVAILASDLLAYHEDHPSPTSKMLAVQAMAEHFAGRGPLLLNEDDEFDKYFARAAETDVAFDSLSPRQAILIAPDTLFDQFYDLDQETLAYAESFPLIVTRRSPIASRPPSNFKLVYSNRYYLGWARQPGPTVVSHLSLQSQWGGTATPPCTAVESLAHDAPHGSELIAAVTPVSTGFDILGAPSRPANWGLNLNPYGSVTPIGPGYVHEIVTVPASGSYQAWVQGSFSRPVSVLVDNRAVGSVDGLDSIDQWSEAGVVRLSAGRHELAIRRGGGRIYPGDGTTLSEIGYVTLKEVGPERLVHVSLSSWHTLCGRPADWIELVRP